MTIQGDTGGSGTKAIATRYPVTEGTTGGTTKQTGKVMNLVPEEDSLIQEKDKVGL